MREYQPITLLKTRTYPAYQFYASLSYKGQPADRCFCFAILTIMDWLRKKIGAINCPTELDVPMPEAFEQADIQSFSSYHLNEGFSVDITSLPDKGIWTLQIKEPETEHGKKRAVIGRFYVTDVGLRLHGDDVECGVCIHVLDPLNAEEEVDFAFRPAFLRQLIACGKVEVSQIEKLTFNRSICIDTTDSLNRLAELIGNQQSIMPIAVFTHAIEQKKVRDLVEKLDAVLGLSGQPNSFLKQFGEMHGMPEELAFGNAFLPYDADYVAFQTCGYGRTYSVSEELFAEFKAAVSDEIQPGDVVWFEPQIFGGIAHIIPYDPQMSGPARERVRSQIIHDIQAYSKQKRISYGSVVFETAARRMEVEERVKSRINLIESGEEQRIADIYAEAEALVAVYDQEKRDLEAELESLTEEFCKLVSKSSHLEKRVKREEKEGITIRVPDVKELYADEIRDLIISILQDAQGRYRPEGSRAEELLTEILELNTPTGEGKAIFGRLKAILFRNKNITDSDISDLEAIGFEVCRHANNHYKLSYRGDTSHSFSLPSTSSDLRSLKNSYAEIVQQLSVYK